MSDQPDAAEEVLLDQPRTADRLGVSVATLQRWRRVGTGPAYVRLGPRFIRYRESTLAEYLAARESA